MFPLLMPAFKGATGARMSDVLFGEPSAFGG